jgi:ATP-binding cassette subfamily B protein
LPSPAGTVLSGWLILQGILQGRFPSASIWLWGLLLLSTVPCQVLVLTAQSRLAVNMGALFKQRLLYGALQLQPDAMRYQGIGQFWGRVMEAEVLETLGLASGFAELTALVQLITVAVILAVSPDGWLHLCLLGLWLGVMLGLGWGYFRRRQTWIQLYREMTNDLVERLVGHRTRLAQQDYAHWHDEEDESLAHYLRASARVDRSQLPFHGFSSQGWLLLGFVGMTYTLLVTPSSMLEHAILLGGIVLAARALQTLSRDVLSGAEL